MTLPTILTLDLGTTTGWAIRPANGPIYSGTAAFKNGRFEGGGMRYLRFTNWLTELDRLSGPIAAIWFEEVRAHRGVDASHVYGGLLATLTSWCELHGIPYRGVPVGTIKRHATGKGNANKAAMIAAAQARGFSPADDNEADALALLHWAIDNDGEEQVMRPRIMVRGLRVDAEGVAQAEARRAEAEAEISCAERDGDAERAEQARQAYDREMASRRDDR